MRDMQVRMLFQDGGFGGTQFVELTPGLGSYFGTDKGLLVVRAPANGRFKLQDGDVLLDIDGRVPASVGHAMQILGSYNAGEKVKLHLMRQKQKLELAIDLPVGD
jgi:S1-C subfamily serine protease